MVLSASIHFFYAPLHREIQNRIEDPFNKKILESSIKKGDTVSCSFKEVKFNFAVVE